MIRAEAEAIVARTPREVLEWVLDLERYRRADLKITHVYEQVPPNASGRGRVRYRGRLRGVRTPPDTNEITLDRWSRLTFIGAPGIWTRRLVDFEGILECEPVDGGTRVVHRETFWFHPAPVERLARAYLGSWLQREIEREMARLEALVDQSTRAGQ